jgi:hypothetical protein
MPSIPDLNYVYLCSGTKPPEKSSQKNLTLNNIIRLLIATVTLLLFIRIQVVIA